MQKTNLKLAHMALITVISFTFISCASRQQINSSIDTSIQEQQKIAPKSWSNSNENKEVVNGWIETFKDPLLSELVKEAMENNKDLVVASSNVEKARALARQAGASLVPSVGLNIGGQQQGMIEGANSAKGLNLGLQVNWELDIWGKLRAGSQAAQSSFEATQADYLFATYSLAATVAKSYFTAIEAGLQLDSARRSLEVLQETLKIVNVQFDNGLITAQDVAVTKSDIASAKERLYQAQASQKSALRALELLLGRYPSSQLQVKSKLPQTPLLPPAGIPSELLERRADLVAAERRVASAFNRVAQAKATRLPSIGLTGSLGGASNTLSTLLSPQNIAWQLGANLLAPIFDGGAAKAEVEISTADQKQALAQYAKVALQAFSEVEEALDSGKYLALRQSESKEALDEIQKAYKIAKLRYEEGESSLLDLLSIQNRLIQADSNLITLNRLMLDQRVNLNLALGGTW